MPWSNGGGITHELLRIPWQPIDGSTLPSSLSTPPFALRISCAEVAADGPFSHFTGVDRFLLPLEGRGLRLESAAGGDSAAAAAYTVCSALLQPPVHSSCPPVVFAFPGEQPWHCSLVDGVAVLDFNVMVARALGWRVSVRIIAPNESIVGATYVFALRDGCIDSTTPVQQYELLRVAEPQSVECRVTAPCIIICVAE